MEIDDQEEKNEEDYKNRYLGTNANIDESENNFILKDGEKSPCPFCLEYVTNKDSYVMLLVYTIFNDSTGETNHMEIFHQSCYVTREREIRKIERQFHDGK